MITREIKRRNGDVHTILLDDCDACLFDAHKWYVSQCGSKRNNKKLYVQRHGETKNRVQESNVKLHRAITGAKEGETVDHRDRNPLNNQRSNLRICTRQQNQCNIGHKGAESGYIGVHRMYGKSTPWVAKVKCNGKVYYAGSGHNPAELAVKRDLMALKLHGDFAVLNFPALRAEAVEPMVLAA